MLIWWGVGMDTLRELDVESRRQCVTLELGRLHPSINFCGLRLKIQPTRQLHTTKVRKHVWTPLSSSRFFFVLPSLSVCTTECNTSIPLRCALYDHLHLCDSLHHTWWQNKVFGQPLCLKYFLCSMLNPSVMVPDGPSGQPWYCKQTNKNLLTRHYFSINTAIIEDICQTSDRTPHTANKLINYSLYQAEWKRQ